MSNFSLELKTAIDAAKKGAEAALPFFNKEQEMDLKYKDDNSTLTAADIASEEAIKSYILSVFPDAEFIAEESDDTTSSYENVWIIDPIDGTTEFSRGIDSWSILIAYAKNKEIVVGVCFFPVRKDLLYAEKSKGAFMNDALIKVSALSDLRKALIGFSPFRFFNEAERIKLISVLDNAMSSRGTVCSYSANNVALGRFDAYVGSPHNGIWDIAPFVPIVKEAGGKITDWNGEELNIENRRSNMIVSNGLLHSEIIKILSVENKSNT